MTIVREWSGHVPAEWADGFHEHLLTTGVAEAEATDGFLGSTLLRRVEGDRVRFTLLTRWTGSEAVRRFAGDDADAARLYPGDEDFGLVPHRTAIHHEAVRSSSLTPVRHAYAEAAKTAAALLRDPAVAADWDRASALEHYPVSGLAGHLAGQIFFAENALAGPEPDIEPLSILEYYYRLPWLSAGPHSAEHLRIRQGSQAQAADGAAALAARAEAAASRLPTVLAAQPLLRRVQVPSWQWSLTFDDFLLSRLLELTVHIDDLAVSTGLPTPDLSPKATEPVLGLLTHLAIHRHGTLALLRALSRSERAPRTIAAL